MLLIKLLVLVCLKLWRMLSEIIMQNLYSTKITTIFKTRAE